MFDRARLLGWWYVCIGAGFALLALRNYMYGARAWSIALRVIIAFGFVLLGAVTLRAPRE